MESGNEEFVELSLGQLKDYLLLRGLNTTGNKKELAARATAAYEQCLSIKINDEKLQQKLKATYDKRLLDNNISADPFKIPEKDWSSDVGKWISLHRFDP